jgi:predicted GH43/DUF377 family glycosyl hydrolase
MFLKKSRKLVNIIMREVLVCGEGVTRFSRSSIWAATHEVINFNPGIILVAGNVNKYIQIIILDFEDFVNIMLANCNVCIR